MAYDGQVATIQLGIGGLLTDTPDTNIPAKCLVRAKNCIFYNDVLEKDFGSRRWNSTALTSPIVNMVDFWLNETSQSVMTFSGGQIYRHPNYFTNTQVTAGTGAPATLNGSYFNQFVIGGSEVAGNARKCFLLTGFTAPQVIYSTASTVRNNLTLPASDWTGSNQPFGGVIFGSRLYAWGNQNNPHAVYASSATNHEDFTTLPLNFLVYPGESEKIVGGYVSRGTLYVVKYPTGVYQLVQPDLATPSGWYFTKFTDSFGGVSPVSMVGMGNDILVTNEYGSITSLQASLVFGDLTQADLFHQLKIQRFADTEFLKDSANYRFIIYYPNKKMLFASYRNPASSSPNRLLIMDFKDQTQTKVSWSEKDQANCLALVKDDHKVKRPWYGANDGYLYQMDQVDRWVGTASSQTAYEMDAWTPYIDFGQADPQMGEQNKIFDFAELVYEPTGDWDVTMSIYIDGRFSKSHSVNLKGRSTLDSLILDSPQSVMGGTEPYSVRLPIQGSGRRISFRFQQSGSGQNVRLDKLRLYYRVGGNQANTKGT